MYSDALYLAFYLTYVLTLICRNIKLNKTMIGFSGPWLLLTTVMKKSDKWVPQVSTSLDHEFVVHFSISAKNLPHVSSSIFLIATLHSLPVYPHFVCALHALYYYIPIMSFAYGRFHNQKINHNHRTLRKKKKKTIKTKKTRPTHLHAVLKPPNKIS